MSSIDNRIVQMQFENSQFEKGVAESLKTLESLKKNLDMKDAGKSLESLQRAGNSFSLAKMANGIEEIGQKFSALGIIGKRVLENLADSAYRMGVSFVKSVSIDQVTAGWAKYADKTKAVQQIVNSTGLSIEAVNEQLEKLNWFTDETSYSFTDMVSNIGKFTSMNIPLEKSVTAMQGISTWAALSGAGVNEASRAMYNLSQAIGLGAVRMQDWKSIALANMATAEFKQTAIDTAVAMGKLKKGAVSLNTFESSLAKGWFTSDVLMDVLEKYGSAANDIYEIYTEQGVSTAQAMDMLGDKMDTLGGRAFRAAQEAKTFTEAIEATKDAVSSNWMNIFENIFGNYEEAKVLWTDLANWLWETFASPLSDLNDTFSEWKELGGRTELLEGLYDIFHSLTGVINAVKDALHDVFPPITTENLMKLSGKVKEFGANLKELLWWCEIATKTLSFKDPLEESTEGLKEFNGELKRGARGDEVKELQKKLEELGFSVGKAGVDGIFGPDTEAALKKYQESIKETADGIFKESTFKKMYGIGVLEKIYDTETIKKYGDNLKKLQSIVRGVAATFDIFRQVLGFVGKVGGKVLKVFKPFGDALFTMAAGLGDSIFSFSQWLKDSGKFEEALDKIDKFLEPVGKWAEKASKNILTFFGFGDEADKSNKKLVTFKSIIDNIKESIAKTGVIDKFKKSFERLKTAFETIKPKIKAFWDTFKASLGEKFNNFISGLPDKFANIATALLNFGSGVLEFLAGQIEKLPELGKKVKDFFSTIFGSGEEGSKTNTNIFTKIGQSIKNLFNAIFGFTDENGTKQKGALQRIGSLLRGDIEGFVDGMSEQDQVKWVSRIDKLRDTIQTIKEKIRLAFDALKTLFTGESGEGSSLSDGAVEWIIGVRDKLKTVWENIKSFFSELWTSITGFFTMDVSGIDGFWEQLKARLASFSNVGNWISEKWGKTIEKLGPVWDAVKAFFENLWGNVKNGAKWVAIGIGIVLIFKVLYTIAGAFKNAFSAIESFKKKAQTLAESIKEIAISIAIIAGAIFVLSLFETIKPGSLKHGLLALAAIMGVIAGVFVTAAALNKVKTDAISNVAKSIRNIAIGIGVIAAAILLLSWIPWNKFGIGLAKVAIIMVVLGGFIFALNKLGATKLDIKGIIGVAAAIGILGIIAALIGKADIATLGKGVGSLLVIAVALAILMKQLSKIGNGNIKIKGFLGLSLAIGILGYVASQLGKMSITDLGKGVGSIIVIMAAMAGIIALMGTVGQNLNVSTLLATFLGIAAVIGVFGYVINSIKGVKPDILYSFSISLSIALAAFVAACMIVGNGKNWQNTLKGAASIGGSIGILAGVITGIVFGLGKLDEASPGTIKRGGEALLAIKDAISPFTDSFSACLVAVGALVASYLIGKTSNGVGDMLGGAASIGGALFVLALSVSAIVGGLGWLDGISSGEVKSSIERGGEILNAIVDPIASMDLGVLLTIGGAILLAAGMAKLGIPGLKMVGDAAAIGLAFDALSITVGGLSLAFGALDTIEGVDIQDAATRGNAIIQTVSDSISTITDACGGVENIGKLLGASVIIGITKATGPMLLGALGISAAIGAIVAVVSIVVGALGGLDKITDGGFIDDIKRGAEVLEEVAHAIGSVKTGFERAYNESMQQFGESIHSVVKNTEGIANSETLDADIQKAIEVAEKIHGFFTDLASNQIDQSSLISYNQAANSLSTNMSDFGTAINDFWTGVHGVSEDKTIDEDTTKAIDVATTVKGFFDDITPQIPNGIGLWMYNAKLSSLNGQITKFGDAMKTYREGIGGISLGPILLDNAMALSCARSVANFLNTLASDEYKIETKGVLDEWLTGGTEGETVFASIERLGEAMRSASVNFGDINTDGTAANIMAATEAAHSIAELLAYVGTALSVVDEDGRSIRTNAQYGITDIIQNFLSGESGIATLINNFNASLDGGLDLSGISAAINSVTEFAKMISGQGQVKISTDNFLGDLDATAVVEKLSTFTSTLTDSLSGSTEVISGQADAFNSAGSALASAVSAGMSNTSIDTSGIESAVSQSAEKVKGFSGRFVESGRYLAQGLANGVAFNAFLAISAAAHMAQAMVNTTKKIFGQASPSKVFAQIGRYNDEGLANGMTQYSSVVNKAAEGVGSSAIKTARGSLSNLSSILAEDIDDTPVIKPVVDLSSARAAAGSIGGMFGTQSFGVQTNMLASNASASALKRAKSIQNGSGAVGESSSGTVNTSSNAVNLTGNNFYVRSENDIHSLASEIATLSKQQQRSYGATA